jgi:magnesium chelatase family protein
MSRAMGAALVGVDGVIVEVEVRVSSQLPRVDIVGLPEAAVRESAARVRGAIAAIGRRFPDRRVTVNLAPAAVRKGGAALDLPIALGILAAEGTPESGSLTGRAFLGELALDGRLRPIRGALALVLAARAWGCREVVVPAGNAAETSLAPGIDVRGAPDLGSVVAHLLGTERLEKVSQPRLVAAGDQGPCLSEVRGQEEAKRALEVAAAGGHALLLSGPPGAGKTMLARRLPGLLPALEFEEALEATRVYGAAGLLGGEEGPGRIGEPIVARRPFRAPHHTASTAGLLGGGNPPRPGEVSLAHRGVLLLDELPEFERRTLEALRQVLEDRRICLVRARHACVFPAHFLLVAACNPCPCGWHRSGRRDCRCDDGALARYRRRLSGPLLDRIDLQLSVPALSWRELEHSRGGSPGEATEQVRQRVVAARRRQRQRGVACNGEIPDAAIDDLVETSPEARRLLARAVDRVHLSARAARRALRVARSIADLEGEERVGRPAMAEALSYRGETAEGS